MNTDKTNLLAYEVADGIDDIVEAAIKTKSGYLTAPANSNSNDISANNDISVGILRGDSLFVEKSNQNVLSNRIVTSDIESDICSSNYSSFYNILEGFFPPQIMKKIDILKTAGDESTLNVLIKAIENAYISWLYNQSIENDINP